MKTNPDLKSAILQVVNNQMKENNPPETKQTYERLLKEGYSEIKARQLIGHVVEAEIFATLKNRKPYDNDRFVSALKRLPELPGAGK